MYRFLNLIVQDLSGGVPSLYSAVMVGFASLSAQSTQVSYFSRSGDRLPGICITATPRARFQGRRPSWLGFGETVF
jgi:hypothetical protein